MTEGHTRRLQAILAADVVGYSRLMSRDEEGTLARLKLLEREAVDAAIEGHEGEVVKRLGDGVLAVFPSAVLALRAARALREEALRLQVEEAEPIVYRIGLNVGDVLITEDDIYGDGVNLASRLEGLADPGGIALSASVHDYVRAQDPGPFDDLGERLLKNIDHPVRVYRVRYEDSPPLAGPTGANAWPWLMAMAAALVVGLSLLAWAFWPSSASEAVDTANSQDASGPVTEAAPERAATPEPVAPPPAVANSRAAYPDPETGELTTSSPGPTPVEPSEPGFGERLVDSIADAIEEEFASGSGSSGKPSGQGKVPPGQAKKSKQK